MSEKRKTEDDNWMKLSRLIEELTTSGAAKVDKTLVYSLKQICRQSDDYVREAYRMLYSQLERDHAEIRLSAVQVIDELFNRSHCFRELVLAEFQTFMELTLETDVHQPLPPPNRVAVELKLETIGMIKKWHEKYKDGYKLLQLGYHFLKTCKRVDFEDIEAANVVERRRLENLRERRERQYRIRREKVLEEMSDMTDDIESCIREADTCLTLLLPHPESFHIDCGEDTSKNSFKSFKSTGKSSKYKMKSVKSLEERDSALVQKLTVGAAAEDDNTAEGGIDRTGGEEVVKHNLECKSAGTPTSNVAQSSELPISQCRKNIEKCRSICFDSDPDVSHEGTASCTSAADNLSGSASHDAADQEWHEGEKDVEDGQRRSHGVHSHRLNIEIHISALSKIKIYETENNTDILRTIRDQVSLINNKYIPAVRSWVEVLTKSHSDQTDIQSALDVRARLVSVMNKINKLDIVMRESSTITDSAHHSDGSDSEDEDEEFIEVKSNEWLELCLRDKLNSSEPLINQSQMLQPSTSSSRQVPAALLDQACSSSRHAATTTRESTDTSNSTASEHKMVNCSSEKDLKKKAPVVPFGCDLSYWSEDYEVPLRYRNDSDAKQWWTGGAADPTVDTNALTEIKQRVIEYSGTFEPVKWKCRAPLASGGFCQRMDRKKCPFHGPVVARDELGRPTDPELRARALESKSFGCSPGAVAWDDPTIQAEISAAVGVDLSTKGKGKKKKKKSGLTNINLLHKDTSRKRLENKVLNSSALKRVASSLNELEVKRHQEKFSHNYNYTFTQ